MILPKNFSIQTQLWYSLFYGWKHHLQQVGHCVAIIAEIKFQKSRYTNYRNTEILITETQKHNIQNKQNKE